MERNLFKYILKHSMRDQVLILIVVAVSLAFYYVSLDLPQDCDRSAGRFGVLHDGRG